MEVMLNCIVSDNGKDNLFIEGRSCTLSWFGTFKGTKVIAFVDGDVIVSDFAGYKTT